jgi:hypothetical protein
VRRKVVHAAARNSCPQLWWIGFSAAFANLYGPKRPPGAPSCPRGRRVKVIGRAAEPTAP